MWIWQKIIVVEYKEEMYMKLSEKQAWEWLYIKYKTPKEQLSEKDSEILLGISQFVDHEGMCFAIKRMYYREMIDYDTAQQMNKQIHNSKHWKGGRVYIWPLTKKNRIKRAIFCKKQAKLE